MNYSELIYLFHRAGELKKIKRSGWIRHGIPEPESVADHTFRTTFIAMIMGDLLKVDMLKLVKMALIHDLAEVLAGDITPYDGVTKEEKQRREETSLIQLLSGLPNRDHYLNLWREYEEQKSQEAIILKNIDRFEMALQANEYQQEFPDKDLSEFLHGTEGHDEIPDIGALFEALIYHK